MRPYHAILPSFGENTQVRKSDGTVQQADNNSNCHYFSQSKATLAQIAVKYFAPAYLQPRNNQTIHKVCYSPLLRVSLNAKCLWRILKSSATRSFQSTKGNVPEVSNLHQYRWQNLRSGIIKKGGVGGGVA